MGADDGAEETSVTAELNRDIGLTGAVALGVGTMIAAGIFVLSGLAVGNVGAAAIVAFLAAAVVASFTAFAYAEFASLYPESGGGYMYVANVFDTDLTYIVGWSMILGYPASAAFYLASFSDWFYRFIYPALNVPAAVPFWVSGVVVLGALVAINLKGTEETGTFQVAVTALKVLLILLFLYGGLQSFDASVVGQSLEQNTEGFADFREIGVTSALVFITFFGFEAIATNAEEIEDPGWTVPRAIFVSMGLVTVIYALVVLVIVFATNDAAFLELVVQRVPDVQSTAGAREFVRTHGELAMGYAAEYYLGSAGFYVIIVGALFSMVSAANATVLAGSRVKLAMARRGHLPRQFEELHPELNTPHKAVLLTGGLILFYLAVFTVFFGGVGGGHPLLGIETLTHFADFMLIGGLVVVNLAVVQSRRVNPDADREFEVPFVPWVPALAVLANLVLLVNVEPKAFAVGVVAEVVGAAFWFGSLSEPSTERIEAETPTLVADHEPTDRDFQLVVPVANPDHVDQLMETAVDVAAERDGEVVVTSVVDLPSQTPLSEGGEHADEERSVVRDAMSVAEDADVPVSGTVRVGHDAGEAIVNTVEQYDSDAVLLGWGGRLGRRRDVILGSTVDHVVEAAPCDVLVERVGAGSADVDSILLPTAGGPHAALAAEASRAIARENDATVRVVHVVGPDADESERQDGEDAVAETAAVLEDVPTETGLLEGDDVVATLVEESDAHDVTLIGATRGSLLEQLVFGAVPERVGARAENTVVMTKRNLDVTSRVKRLVTGERDVTSRVKRLVTGER